MSEAEILQISRLVAVASDRTYLNLKRAIDVTICVAALFFLLPFMAIIALAIMLDSPGPFLFMQQRVGKDGRPFRMYKFRTMVNGHDSSEEKKFMADYIAGKIVPSASLKGNAKGKAIYKSANGKDITRLGRFLRASSLDELPQLWNVLLGDMSLIGPRPNVTWEVYHYSKVHCQRLAVRPGITGLAQVRGRSNITFQEIVEHDLEYIHNMNLKLDCQIVWWTVLKLIDHQDAG